MRTGRLRSATLLVALGLAAAARAAPLDALPSAEDAPAGLQLMLARDVANDSVDLLHWRDKAGRSGSTIGRYGGWQGDVLWRSGRLRLDAGLWQRRIDDGALNQSLRSWRLGGQWRLGEPEPSGSLGAPPRTRWALRASAWGSGAERLSRQTGAALVAGALDAQVGRLSLVRPRDRQTQVDLLMSRALAPAWSFHAALGAGRSRVANQAVTGTADVDGCPYTLDFGADQLVATPADHCRHALIVAVPNALLPSAAQPETNYRARLSHAALAVRYEQPGWSLTLGHDWLHWRRERIDALIADRGLRGLRDTRSLVAQLQVELTPHLSGLLRVQVMEHAFLAELPLAYNTQTTGQLSHRYGLVSAGLAARF